MYMWTKWTPFLTFTEHDRRTLNPRTWINDTVVDSWFRWIARNEPFDDVVISFTSHFYSTLITSNGHLEVSRWMHNQDIDIFSKKMILFPLNVNNNHWSLCVICNLDKVLHVLQYGFQDIHNKIPFIMHLDSSPGCHNVREIGNNVLLWLVHELTLRHGSNVKFPVPLSSVSCPIVSPSGKLY
jgi:Ulp1 family protease